MNENALKFVTAGVLAAVGAYFRQLTFPLALLVTVMVIDYASGMLRAWERGELSSKIGLKGIVKKLSYMFAVAVAIAADWVIQFAAGQALIAAAKAEIREMYPDE